MRVLREQRKMLHIKEDKQTSYAMKDYLQNRIKQNKDYSGKVFNEVYGQQSLFEMGGEK